MAVLSETFSDNGGPAGKVVHRSNVLTSDSKTPGDPAEFRAGALPDPSGGLRKDSADRLSADGSTRTERVAFIWKEDAQGRGYLELYGDAVGRGGDMSERDLLARFSHTHPFIRGISHQLPTTNSQHFPNEFHHPNGVVWFVVQEDGNVVVYQNKVQHIPDTGHPIYWTGSQITPGYTEPRERPTPPTPPSPPPVDEPDEVQGVRVIYKTFNEIVRAGDFDRLGVIFAHSGGQRAVLDASDVQAYHAGRISWEGIVQKFFTKFADDDVSK